jgi:ribose transport system substrate-binding protein
MALNRIRKYALGLAGAAALAASMAGSSSAAETKTIGISWPNSSNQSGVQIILKNAKARAAELGWDVVIDDPGADQNRQLNTINSWVNQGFPTLIVIALDPGPFKNVVGEAREKGTKIMTYGASLPGEAGLVAINNVPGGRVLGGIAGKWINDKLGQEAKVAILGFSEAQWGRDRRQGILEGLDSTGAKYKIVAEQDATSETQGVEKMQLILQSNPDINVVLSVEESATEGAYQAFINAGHDKADPKVFLGGMNGGMRALQLLQEGDNIYRGSAAFSFVDLGRGMIEKAIELAKGGAEPAVFNVVYTPLTPGDPKIGGFLKPLQ